MSFAKVIEYAAIGIIGLAIVGTLFTALVCGVMGVLIMILGLPLALAGIVWLICEAADRYEHLFDGFDPWTDDDWSDRLGHRL